MRIASFLLFIITINIFMTAFAESATKEMYEPHFNAGFPGLQERLYITEICIIPPPDTDWPAWVEIWNNTGYKVDLSGYTLETLQQRLEPFGKEFVLEPNQRCLVMAYQGEKKSDSFESLLPDGTKTVRMMNTELFPLYFTMEEWYSKIKKSLKDDLESNELTDEKIAYYVGALFGTTRYINEIALRTHDGKLIGFLQWGRPPPCADAKKSQAAQEAEEISIFGKGGRRPVPRFSQTDTECAVLQMFRHGEYLSLWNAEHTSTPGAPLLRKPSVPKLKLPVKARIKETGGGTLATLGILEFDIHEESVNPTLETSWRWSKIAPELFYDEELTKPVLESKYMFLYDNTLMLTPVDFFCLSGIPLYCRLAKFHATHPPIYSEVYKIRLIQEHKIYRELYPYKENLKRPKVNHEHGVADVEKVARYLEQCNAALIKYRESAPERKGSLLYNILDAGREVVVQFNYRDNMDDISPIAGLPVKKLDISKTKVECIDALKNMPLTELNLSSTPVKDIEVLRGMPLEILDISETEVTDVSPLVGTPLRRLILNPTKVKNLDVLFDEDVEASQKTTGLTKTVDFIRKNEDIRNDANP